MTLVDRYLAENPTPETSKAIVKKIAEEDGASIASVRQKLVAAKVYLKAPAIRHAVEQHDMAAIKKDFQEQYTEENLNLLIATIASKYGYTQTSLTDHLAERKLLIHHTHIEESRERIKQMGVEHERLRLAKQAEIKRVKKTPSNRSSLSGDDQIKLGCGAIVLFITVLFMMFGGSSGDSIEDAAFRVCRISGTSFWDCM